MTRWGARVAPLLAAVLVACPESTPPLKAKVSIEQGMVMVRNFGSGTWGGCELQLNSVYKVQGRVVAAGGEAHGYPVRDFVKRDGTRFNMVTNKPLSMYIHCDQGSWYGEWN